MKLIYYTPIRLKKEANFQETNQLYCAFSQMFNPSISLLDRSSSIICPPIGIENLFPLPTSWKNTSTFEELCRARYEELLSISVNIGKNLVIFYSGGIDSTLIAALAINHSNFSKHRKNIFLAYSEESIKENSKFWFDHLLKNFENNLLSSSDFYTHVADTNNVCVTGEFADNIFGSLTIKSYMDKTNDFSAIHKSFKDTSKPWLLSKITNTQHSEECSNMLDIIIGTSPRLLESNHDCLWWLNFVLKWQAVKYRLASHSPTQTLSAIMSKRLVHFFETEEFQHWAVTTSETKVENDWYSYKLPAKKIIYGINKDDYYFKWKTKYPSIPGIVRYSNQFDFIYLKGSEYYPSKVLIDHV